MGTILGKDMVKLDIYKNVSFEIERYNNVKLIDTIFKSRFCTLQLKEKSLDRAFDPNLFIFSFLTVEYVI